MILGGTLSADDNSSSQFRELSLKQLLETVMQRNHQIEIQASENEIQKWNVTRERSIFEPALVASAEHRENERENTSEQALNLGFNIITTPRSNFDSEDNLYSTGIEGLFPLGTRYALQSRISDLENNLNSFDSEFVSFLGVNITQPLLKNAGVDITTSGIRIATAQKDIALQVLRKEVLGIIARSERDYWELVLAQQEVSMLHESVGIAEKILVDNRERTKAGKMSELEIAQAENGLEIRVRQLIDAKQRLVRVSNNLRTLISESTGRDPMEIVAIDRPKVIPLSVVEFEEQMARATSLNPDYIGKLKELEQEDIRLAFAQNQRWPQLDLTASWGLNGIGDDAGQAIHDITDSAYEAWSIGVQLRMSLGAGKRGKSDLEIAKLRKRKALAELKALETEIANRLSTLDSRLRLIQARTKSYAKEVALSSRILEIELARLSEGKSDSRKVLELEEDLFTVRLAEFGNSVNYQIATLERDLITGSLIDNRGIEIVNLMDGNTGYEN